MSNAEYFGKFDFYHESDQHWRTWHIWAELDPTSFEIFMVYLAQTNMFSRPEKGFPPSQCVSGHYKKAIEQIEILLKEWKEEESNDSEVIDKDDDPKDWWH